MTQPEALRLAGELECGFPVTGSAAAELRRLHAERTAADGVINDLAAKVRGLQTQRDQLLAALKRYHRIIAANMVELDVDNAFEQARAAIKKAEENT